MGSDNKRYPGKLLLFGEYTVIHGGSSLAIPFHNVYAFWDFSKGQVDSNLLRFFYFIKANFPHEFDLVRMQDEIEYGIFLNSNIPWGYGAGSSGSVVAAVYDRYFLGVTPKSLLQQASYFAKMEAFFHGSSSGIDPLISFTQKAILKQNNELQEISVKDLSLIDNLYLFDSNQPRSTEKLVNWYKHQLEIPTFLNRMEQELMTINHQLILSFIQNDKIQFEDSFNKLMPIHQSLLFEMYPDILINKLKDSIAIQNPLFKICGAGGGGYFLVYVNELANIVQDENLIKISDR